MERRYMMSERMYSLTKKLETRVFKTEAQRGRERERKRERFSVLAQKRNGPSKLPALTYPLPPKRPNCGTVSDKSGMS